MAFTITIAPSGRSFEAGDDEPLLAAAIRQGLGLPYGCKDGACGSCKCRLLQGRVQHGAHQSKALSAAEEEAGLILTCCAQPLTDLHIESRQVSQAGAFTVKKMPARVAAMERKTADVMLLRLQLPANDTLQYHAGQYVDILLRDGSRRSYSMANAPHTLAAAPELKPAPGAAPTAPPAGLELHLRHMPGGKFTDHVFGVMKEKEILRIEGPFGSFYLRDDSTKPLIMLASGTGFAPIKALLEHMQFKSIQRPVSLYWGARRPQDLYLDSWVREQLPKMPQLRYVPVVSDALPEDGWTGRTGFVHQAVLQDFADLSGHQVYACGAPIVVESAQTDFAALSKLDPEDFFADAFTSEADKVAP